MLGIYARQSQFQEGNGKESSVEDQIKYGILKAKELNLEYAIYQDVDESAIFDNTDNRPSFNQMLKDIQSGKIKAVFCYEQKRLTRSIPVLQEIAKLFTKHRIIIHTKTQGTIDFTNWNDEFIAFINGLVGKKEVKEMAEKIQSKLLKNCEDGKAGGGAMMPYGYKRDKFNMLVIDEEEAEIYTQIVERYLSGNGCKSIVKWLNDSKIQTKGRKNYTKGLTIKNKATGVITKVNQKDIIWAPNTIRNILINPIYKGERLYKGNTYPAPAIISPEKWNDIQKQRKLNSKDSDRNNKVHFYLLKHMLTCKCCGRNLYGYIKEAKGKAQRVYQCSSKRIKFCGMPSINIDHLNNLIWNSVSNSDFFIHKIVSELNSTDTRTQIENIQHLIDVDKKQLVLVSAKKEKQIALFENEIISMDELKKRNAGFELEKKELDGKIQANTEKLSFLTSNVRQEERLVQFVENVSKNINSYSDADKRNILKQIINNIEIGYDVQLKQHLITVKYNLNVTGKEYNMNSKGESNLKSQKYNYAQFNDKFNPKPHMMLEKYEPEKELLGYNKGLYSTPIQHSLVVEYTLGLFNKKMAVLGVKVA